MNTHERGSVLPEYRSVIANWDAKSSVRNHPRRLLSEEDDGRSFFSADLTPAAAHPLVLDRGEQGVQELLTRRLYDYLDFTTVLEQEIVNPVVLRLSRDAFGLELSGDMKFDAYKIYCDEAYHALFSVDLKRQVQECSGVVSAAAVSEPCFARMIRDVKNQLPAELAGLAELCAAVVSETLITGSLTKIPADPSVVGAIRETISDHAADERTHHAYFTRVLEFAWPQIDKATQRLLGPHFADFILAFLIPDDQAQHRLLSRMGFGHEQVLRILAETQPMDQTLTDARQAARSTIRLLQRTGVLTESRTRDYFAQLKLVD